MIVTADAAKQAISQLTREEVLRLFSSTTGPHGRTSMTKFSTALTALLIRSHSREQLVVRGTFKGNKSGRSGGGSGQLADMAEFARRQFEFAGHSFMKEEVLLDYLISGKDILEVVMTVESEARPLARAKDMHDLEKLILVTSPNRLYVGRVNLTKGGRTHKVQAAKQLIEERLNVAISKHCMARDTVFNVVLLTTSHDSARRGYLGSLQNGQVSFVDADLSA